MPPSPHWLKQYPGVLVCPGHHRGPDDSLVVVLNPPTGPSRAHSEGGREKGGAASKARGRI